MHHISSRQTCSRTHDDYRLGDSLQVNLGTSYPLMHSLGLLAQINLLVKDRDGIGQTREEVQKTGGEFLYVSPRLEVRLPGQWKAYTLIQIPIYQLLFGVTYRFRGWGANQRVP